MSKYQDINLLKGKVKNLQELRKISQSFKDSELMPVLFLGHGSPMNAIEENQFVEGFRNVAKKIKKPEAILCISAHWETNGSYITAAEFPKTIHDFGGFPKELFQVEYPAPGDPALAKEIKNLISTTEIGLDLEWGLDHGSWSVIKHLYPDADIPVLEFSLNYKLNPQQHYDLAKELKTLRKKGVLIIGSGNIVHNLRAIAWDKINSNFAFDWGLEANNFVKKCISNREHLPLFNPYQYGSALQYAIPTAEHYLPLLYTLALEDKTDEISFFNDEFVGGSLSMTSVLIS